MVESGRPAWLVWDAPPFEGGEGWTPERVDGYLAALLRELLRTKNDVRCQGASALSEMHLSAALSDAEERIDEMIDVTVAMRELRQPSEWSGRVCKPRVDQWVSRINVHNPFIDPTERPGPARSEAPPTVAPRPVYAPSDLEARIASATRSCVPWSARCVGTQSVELCV